MHVFMKRIKGNLESAKSNYMTHILRTEVYKYLQVLLMFLFPFLFLVILSVMYSSALWFQAAPLPALCVFPSVLML